MRSDEAYEQKKGFNLMFVINGDGDGSGDTGSGDPGSFQTNVIKNDVIIDTDISSDEDYTFTFHEDDQFYWNNLKIRK